MFPFSGWGNDNGAPTFNNGPSSASGQQSIVGSSLPPPAARVTRNTATNAQTNGARIATVDANQGYFTGVYDYFRTTLNTMSHIPPFNIFSIPSDAKKAATSAKKGSKKAGEFLSSALWKLVLIIALIFIGYVVIKTLAVKAATRIA